MKRKIIQIDEDLCNGCGECTVICAEAALEMVDGKAKVVGDFLCDGMGACLDVCDVDALKIVEKDVEEYDSEKAYDRVKELRGESAAKKVHGYKEEESDVDSHGEMGHQCACPGSAMQDFTEKSEGCCDDSDNHEKSQNIGSELRQWPTQLHLLSPEAPYFEGSELLVSADCAPFAYGSFHPEFLKGKSLAMFCPKLDHDQEIYAEKLAEIFKNRNIKSVTVVKMEVPCCGGVGQIVRDAIEKSGKTIPYAESTISIQGELM